MNIYSNGTYINIDQKDHLFFGGTAYLGLNHHPDILSLINEGFHKYGTNYGASRLNNTCFDLYEMTEQKMANWLEFESAVLCSSGTVASMMIIQQLRTNYHFIHFKDLHPSLSNNLFSENLSIIGTHNSEELLKTINNAPKKPCLLVNSINPIQLIKTNFEILQKVERELLLVIDDSHGFGILGPEGRGIISELSNLPKNIELIITGSLGKSLSIPAGIILGNDQFCSSIKNNSTWGGSAPTTPAFIHCLYFMDEIIKQQREKLFTNIKYFCSQNACNEIFDFLPQFPVFKFKKNGNYSTLKSNGIIVSGLSYPSKKDPFIERVIVSSLHSKSDIDLLFQNLGSDFL